MYLHLYKIWDYRNVICIFAFSYGQTVIPRATGTRIHDKGGMDRLLAVSVWPVGFIWQVFISGCKPSRLDTSCWYL
jgi:hypothetical protein